jgi:hypothetical protein
MTGSLCPVDPRPLDPLAVTSRVSTSTMEGVLAHSRINCAIRSPCLMSKRTSELFIKQTISSPLYPGSITPAPMSIQDFVARPERGAIRPYVPEKKGRGLYQYRTSASV